jgi:hypothetical protein
LAVLEILRKVIEELEASRKLIDKKLSPVAPGGALGTGGPEVSYSSAHLLSGLGKCTCGEPITTEEHCAVAVQIWSDASN